MVQNNVQPTYTEHMPVAVPGLIKGSDYDTVTGNCVEDDGIGFGLAVSQSDSGDINVDLGGDIANFRGVSVRDITLITHTAANVDKYEKGNNMSILKRGTIWVQPGESVAPSDPVHFDTATGVFGKSGGTGPVKGARWASTAAGNGDFAILELSGYQGA